ncbi:MAG: phosphodiester glycosidase family protein [Desulfosporosinus sp.]|nr:phosphodiester glycosidase family protein [Desulfosporosinus sp.]
MSAETKNATPPIYALGNNGQIKEILVNAHKGSSPNQIYKIKTPSTSNGYTITLPPEILSTGSQVNDTELTMQYPYIFYISSFNGQPQSIDTYNLQSKTRNIFAFSGIIEKVKIVPVNKNQVNVQLVENKQTLSNVFLTMGKDSITSNSSDLQLMLNPSDNTSAFIRLVEGVKQIMGNGTVAFIENMWYKTKDSFTNLVYSFNSINQHPALTNPGGTQAILSLKPALPASKTDSLVLPAPVSSPPLEKSITYPDPSRPYVKANLVKIDTKLVNFHLVAGTQDPISVTGIHGIGMIPLSAQQQEDVIAAFNGGFQARDGRYGFMAENRIYQSPVPGLATFCVYKSGKVDIGSWGNEIKSEAGIVSFLQNLHLLIDNGGINPLINDQSKWGATVGNAVRVWRSGIGIDQKGQIIYTAGDNLTSETLARALLSAGSIRAMELDINSYWVTFNFLQRTAGTRGNTLEGTKLDPSMTRPANRYLTPDSRDFFYLTLKPSVTPK